jgi:aminoglycoside phosphotransferase
MTRFRRAITLPDLVDDQLAPHVLLGPEAVELLDQVVGAAGGAVDHVTPRQVTYHPGHSLTVRYDVRVRWAGGVVRTEWFVLATGAAVRDHAVIVENGVHRIAVWRFPHDPGLPGLARAIEPASVLGVLAELGVEVDTARTRLRAYRPGRRAVVEIDAPGARLFLKVLRPRAAERLHRAHAELADHAPVPRSLGWSAALGMVVLQALPGRTLREHLAHTRTGPGPSALVALLDLLPPAPPSFDAVRRRTIDVDRHAALIAAVRPELTTRLMALAGTITDSSKDDDLPLVPAHGDFHEAQILVDRGVVTGLLDVDTFGTGHRVDDLATMIGHLATLAVASPRRRAIEAYARALVEHFDSLVDPSRLRVAIAGVVLGLATGPFRVLEAHWPEHTDRRVALAEDWLRSARLDAHAIPAG